MTRSHVSLSLYAALIFAGGAAVGALGHRLYESSPVSAKAPGASTPDEWRRKFISEMQQRVHLDADQMVHLNAILDESRTLFQQVKEKYRPEMKAIHYSQMAKIKTMLRDDQKAEYQKVLDEREQRAREAERERAAAPADNQKK